MSNTLAAQPFPGIVNEEVTNESTPVEVQKHNTDTVPLKLSEKPELEELVTLYGSQDRECWLCEGVANKIASGNEISEDDNWHFTSCVLSWEYLHRSRD